MTEPRQIAAQSLFQGQLKLPWDLSEWVSKDRLLQWIEEEIATLDWSNPALPDYLRKHPGTHPRILLCLLTYCYASGEFETEGIVDRCYRDACLRKLCGESVPMPKEVVRFRRENRGLIRWALRRLLRNAVRSKFNLGEVLWPAGFRQTMDEAATMRLDIARHMDSGSSGF